MAKGRVFKNPVLLIVLILGAVFAATVGWRVVRAVRWYTVDYPALQKSRQAFVLNPVNQPPILQACRQMLANPAAYPQAPGDPFPTGLPPAITSLGATSVIKDSNGVLIMFGRDFGLYVPADPAKPVFPNSSARPLIPGLWHLTYGGN